ncbi:MAG: AlpA family phage regulatory protein [Accumulibacter sp.]|jgi:predicted DNA-binding transcriptional regulator AlpA|uniref:helix-turn-helix transcriptional regulator n=1 Tax=Accumulibacter sp. TaxID=2053492 RepID=UPI002FC2A2A4
MTHKFGNTATIVDVVKEAFPATDSAPVRIKEVGISDALKNFDSLPDSASVRLPVVRALKACSAATVWRMVRRGDLPAPRKLSQRITAWNVGELRKALAA